MSEINPIAFSILGLDIHWYGILIAVGIALAAIISYRRAPKHGINQNDFLDGILIGIPAGVIGARVYYIIFNWGYYSSNPSAIWERGGLAIHGGLILAGIAVYFFCRHKKINFLNALDLVVPTVALAQSIGRWGNYFNSEAYGSATDLPWAITINGQQVHPTFLYESIWCLLLFVFLIFIDNRRKFTGQVACLYGILYSVERFFVEALRTDSLMVGPLKQAQLLSIVVIIVCLIIYIRLNNKKGDNK